MVVSYVLAALQPTLVCFPLAMLLSGAGFAIAHSTLQAQVDNVSEATGIPHYTGLNRILLNQPQACVFLAV
jgi:hypothetical protein